MPPYSTFTKYPKIYSGSHWGRHRASDILEVPEEILLHRNELVETFHITSYAYTRSKNTEIQARILDGTVIDRNNNPVPLTVYNAHKFVGSELHRHYVEYYRAGRSTVAVFSQHTDDKEHALILRSGYGQWKPLCDATAMRTYLKIIYGVRDTTTCLPTPTEFLLS
jgi:hypothetical protein